MWLLNYRVLSFSFQTVVHAGAMSLNYASALSAYEDKGVCGLPEIHDPDYIFEQKVTVLTDLLRQSPYTVVHTGAGLSTSSGIPDFRGPNGVWTLEKHGKSPSFSQPFDSAIPSIGHMALVALEKAGYINYVITQNIDGLHLRSGFPRNRLSILHGDVFLEKCRSCGAVYVRSAKTSPTIGLKTTGARCTKLKTRVRPCGGKLIDSVLDWEDELPEPDYALAVKEARNASIHLCLGISPHILPTARLPFRTSGLGLPRKRLQPICVENAIIDLTNGSADDDGSLFHDIPSPQVDDVFMKFLALHGGILEGKGNFEASRRRCKRFKQTPLAKSTKPEDDDFPSVGGKNDKRKAQRCALCLDSSFLSCLILSLSGHEF
uniref:protein acetyllysine N-acetyltransferase n=1 Tax=Mesocestoides corti TaxID=53468 RepID=A0A5K3FKN2_MESCO